MPHLPRRATPIGLPEDEPPVPKSPENERSRWNYLFDVWRYSVEFVAMFSFGIFLYEDLLFIIVDGMNGHGNAYNQVHGVRFVPTLFLIFIMLAAWLVFPQRNSKNEIDTEEYGTPLFFYKVAAYGYKFTWAIWLSLCAIQFLQMQILQVPSAAYPYPSAGFSGCNISLNYIPNTTFYSQTSFYPTSAASDFGFSVAAIVIIGLTTSILAALFCTLYDAYKYTYESHQLQSKFKWPEFSGWRSNFSGKFLLEFALGIDKGPLASFQYIYSFVWGWFVAFSLVPGWAILMSTGSACQLALSFINGLCVVVVIASQLVAAGIGWAAYLWVQDEHGDGVFYDNVRDAKRPHTKRVYRPWRFIVRLVRQSYEFSLAVMWAMWFTYGLNPVLTYAMFEVDVTYSQYAPVLTYGASGLANGISNMVGYLLLVTILASLVLFLWWVGFERTTMYPHQGWWAAMFKVIDDPAHKPHQKGDFAPPKILSGIFLTFEFTNAYMWAWWFTQRFINLILYPSFPGANVDGATFALPQFCANLVVTGILFAMWGMVEGARVLAKRLPKGGGKRVGDSN